MKNTMGYSIRKNWAETFALLVKKPVLLLPYFVIAFLEALALEFVFFSTRKPLSVFFNPIVKKFFGEVYIHYPGNLLLLPNLFYYLQVVIYIFIGVALSAVTVNMARNVRAKLPLKANSIVRNALKFYLSYIIFGIITIALVLVMKKAEMYVFSKGMSVLAKHLPTIIIKLVPYEMSLLLFFSNIILQVFIILTVPLIVLKKKMIIRALWESIALGFRNFFSILFLIFVPFVVYLPLVILRTAAPQLVAKTAFPEINVVLTAAGIVATAFIECFVIVSVTQFVLDKEGARIPE